jgi:hypothetical protein
MPYKMEVPDVVQRITVKGDSLRGLFWARDMMNALFFMGQRRMSFSAAIHVLVEWLRREHEKDPLAVGEWLEAECHRLAPKFTGKPTAPREYSDGGGKVEG